MGDRGRETEGPSALRGIAYAAGGSRESSNVVCGHGDPRKTLRSQTATKRSRVDEIAGRGGLHTMRKHTGFGRLEIVEQRGKGEGSFGFAGTAAATLRAARSGLFNTRIVDSYNL